MWKTDLIAVLEQETDLNGRHPVLVMLVMFQNINKITDSPIFHTNTKLIQNFTYISCLNIVGEV